MDPKTAQVRGLEARALLDLNQRRRAQGEATLILVLLLAAAGLASALATRNQAIVIPLPGVGLLLLALSFQQYADVSVIGAARAQLERALNDHLGGPGFIYESYVAGIRQRQPLVGSVRVLQGLVTLAIAAGIVGASIVAFRREALVWVPYTVFTGLAALSAALSYRDMLRSYSVAAAELAEALGPATANRPPVPRCDEGGQK